MTKSTLLVNVDSEIKKQFKSAVKRPRLDGRKVMINEVIEQMMKRYTKDSQRKR